MNPPVEEDEHHKRLSPEDVQVMRWKGGTLMDAQKFSEAEPIFVRLHAEFDDNASYTYELARIRNSQKKYEEEAALWEQFIQHSPTPVEGCPAIGNAYRESGKDDKALDALKRCWEFEPTNSDMILFYALELEHNGEKKKAHDLYVKGHGVSPHYGDIIVGLARTEMSLGNLPEARKHILEVLARRPDNVDALFAAGLIMSRSGDTAAARRYLQHGVELSPTYDEMKRALASLGSAGGSRHSKRRSAKKQ
ncbi:MAG TPA: tetratricopeptide repeat protein [Bryobacteraceae bacterium]